MVPETLSAKFRSTRFFGCFAVTANIPLIIVYCKPKNLLRPFGIADSFRAEPVPVKWASLTSYRIHDKRAGLHPAQSGRRRCPGRLAAGSRYRCGGRRRRHASTNAIGGLHPYHNDHTATGMERSRFSPPFESGSRDVACGTIQNARVPRGAVHRGEQRH